MAHKARGAWARAVLAVGAVPLIAACSSSGGRAIPTTTSAAPTTSTTAAGVQTSGDRTVLSPLGINVRANPARTAHVLGTADQGTVLRVLGHTDAGGGWFEVRGQTVTGWITGDPKLTAAGAFQSYSSNSFSALYPEGWKVTPSAAGVGFLDSSGPDSIRVTSAATVDKLPKGRAGYSLQDSKSVVVCGVTSHLVTYSSAGSYLLQVRLTIDAHHALGVYGTLTGLGAPLAPFQAFLYSLSFPGPQCT